MAEALGMKYQTCKSAVRALDKKGIIKRTRYRSKDNSKWYNKFMLAGFINLTLLKKDLRSIKKNINSQEFESNGGNHEIQRKHKNTDKYQEREKLHDRNDLASVAQVTEEIRKAGFEGEYSRQIRKCIYFATKILRMSLKDWLRYLNLVKSSKFLSGKVGQFKATLEWIVCERNIRKVLTGFYKEYAKKTGHQQQTGQPTQQQSMIKKIWGIVRSAMATSKFDFNFLERELRTLGILEKVEKAVYNLGNFKIMSEPDLNKALMAVQF